MATERVTRVVCDVCDDSQTASYHVTYDASDFRARLRLPVDLCRRCADGPNLMKLASVIVDGRRPPPRPRQASLMRPLHPSIMFRSAADNYLDFIRVEGAKKSALQRASRAFDRYWDVNGDLPMHMLDARQIHRFLDVERAERQRRLLEFDAFLNWCRWRGAIRQSVDPLAEWFDDEDRPFDRYGLRRKPWKAKLHPCINCEAPAVDAMTFEMIGKSDRSLIWLCPTCPTRLNFSEALELASGLEFGREG